MLWDWWSCLSWLQFLLSRILHHFYHSIHSEFSSNVDSLSSFRTPSPISGGFVSRVANGVGTLQECVQANFISPSIFLCNMKAKFGGLGVIHGSSLKQY